MSDFLYVTAIVATFVCRLLCEADGCKYFVNDSEEGLLNIR